MHIVSHGFASLMLLVSLDETTLKWVVFLEFEISCGFIVTQNGGDSQVFRAGIEDNSSWLTYWRSHENSSKIDSIVSTVKWNL